MHSGTIQRTTYGNGLRRLMAVAVLVGFLPVATSACFGKFELTRKVYAYNQDVSEDKWVQWVAFLGLSIFPVYFFATLIDVLLGNSFEFWTGENPILAHGPNGEVAVARVVTPGVVDLTITDADGRVRSLTLVAEGDGAVARDGAGNEIARLRDARELRALAAAPRL
ncbi:MAG: DUF3332 family protein [Deltaproteobacteria bacterium]|nr:MAG: DUF3332 family protein [Deltaproteobacteria bacterium]